MSFSLLIYKIIVISFCLSFGMALAEAQKTYIISVENISYNPYFSTDSYDNYSGFSRELFDLFAEKSKINLKFQPMPVARLSKEFFNGNLDFKFPDVAEWQKDKRINKNIFYSNNVVEYIDGIIVKVENKGKDLSFLKTLGTIRGFDTSLYNMKGILIDESSNIPELIDKLNHNMVDAVFFNVSVAIHHINNNKQYKNKFMFKRDFPYLREYYKLSTMKHKDVIDKFNIFLKKNIKKINALKQKNGIIF